MARRLSRVGFFVLLLLVGVWLILNMPTPQRVGRTPSSRLVTFSVNPTATELHRRIQRARHSERRGDRLRDAGSGLCVRQYRLALSYYRQAGTLLGERFRRGYLDDRIRRSLERVRRKLRRVENT